ncbi:gluconate kinase, SKI family [Arboricoccus pini]|uniref:Gluconokinase n=1 Tax=Arboricoccus pini TaxID=1963835 RepID=A0A212RZU7_9PROT|nr:gluconokinase [Arboricoccus pini]SNB78293.1 gluconate kinase, SKI family [Arboricoccus pini]
MDPVAAAPHRPFAVIVMGVSGSGKSTIGGRLAEILGVPFLEGDQFHPKANIDKMTAGIPLHDEDRWPWLDRLGEAIGQAARAKGGVVNASSALKRSYRARLVAAAGMPIRFICLFGDKELIASRLQKRKGHYMPPALLDSQLADFEKPLPSENALILDLGSDVETLVAEALADIRAYAG